MQFIRQPYDDIRIGDWILARLSGSLYRRLRIAVAFVKSSGVIQLQTAMQSFLESGGNVQFAVGVDHRGTSVEGLRRLQAIIGDQGEVWIVHNPDRRDTPTFHPKIFLFEGDGTAEVVIGSTNLTKGGLFTNYEASVAMKLQAENPSDAAILQKMSETFDGWCRASDITQQLNESVLDRLIAERLIVTEAEQRQARRQDLPVDSGNSDTDEFPDTVGTSLFRPVRVRSAPRPITTARHLEAQEEPPTKVVPGEEADIEAEAPAPVPVPAQSGNNKGFVMTLQQTDMGRGQTTPGTSQRSPEIFIPLAGRDHDPEFWGWPDLFTEDPAHQNKMDRFAVPIRIGTSIIGVNMMTWPDKHDFRLRSEAIRSAGNVGDILRVERSDGTGGFAYYVEVIPVATSEYDKYDAHCDQDVKNSIKRWGYY
jgi:HKD family nuclease